MTTLTIFNSNTPTMPLKEITDLLDVEHGKAMHKVTKMAMELDFGTVAKIEIAYNSYGQTTETYLLNKRQSIAVAAQLNTSLLMKIIDRWQQLESQIQQSIPQTHIQAVEAYLHTLKVVEAQKIELGVQMGIIEDQSVLMDTSMKWFTVSRVKPFNPDMVISGSRLTQESIDQGVPYKSLYAPYNLNTPNTYREDIWRLVYPTIVLPKE